MRPIFCGNLEFDAQPSDLERLFQRFGKVERVDMKTGFAFVHMDDEREAEDAIRRLDRTEFGDKGRQLRVEWTKQDRGTRGPGDFKRPAKNPAKTLFVINFDPDRTRTRDLEKHFEPYGRLLNIRIRKNFAFVEFELQADATKALVATHMSNFMDNHVISVEYASHDDNGFIESRHYSDARKYYDQKRSLSPYRWGRGSPDYGRGSNPNSRTEAKQSPDNGWGSNPNSRTEAKRSPDHGWGSNPNSGTEAKRSPDHGWDSNPNSKAEAKRSPDHGWGSNPNSRIEVKRSPDSGWGSNPNSRTEEKRSFDHGWGSNLYSRTEAKQSSDHGWGSNLYSRTEVQRSLGHGLGSNPNLRTEAKRSLDHGWGSNPNSRTEAKRSADHGWGSNPNSRTEAKRSPDHGWGSKTSNSRNNQDQGTRGPGDFKRQAKKPAKSLFVINFDPDRTRTRDLEKHFEPYGRLLNIRIRKNFAFVEFELQADATKALAATHLSNFMDNDVIRVEYASRDENGVIESRHYSDARRNYDQKRSLSPFRWGRGIPDYGRGSSLNSRTEAKQSPDYSWGSNPNSRTEAKWSADYGWGSNPNSRTGAKQSPDYGRGSDPNSRTEAKQSPDHVRGSDPNSRTEAKRSPDIVTGSPINERNQSCSPPPPPPKKRSRS